MKWLRIHAALIVVASGLIASSMARTCPIGPEATLKLAALGSALVSIEMIFPLHPSNGDESAVLARQFASTAPPLALDDAVLPSARMHPAIFFDFDFAAAQDRTGSTPRR